MVLCAVEYMLMHGDKLSSGSCDESTIKVWSTDTGGAR
jgi:hypothetical protein